MDSQVERFNNIARSVSLLIGGEVDLHPDGAACFVSPMYPHMTNTYQVCLVTPRDKLLSDQIGVWYLAAAQFVAIDSEHVAFSFRSATLAPGWTDEQAADFMLEHVARLDREKLERMRARELREAAP